MPSKVIVVHAEPTIIQPVVDFCKRRGDQVTLSTSAEQAQQLALKARPDLVVLDLHLPGEGWLELLQRLRRDQPATKILLTNSYPDFRREIQAKEQGVQVFLRQPFTRQWIERALQRLEEGDRARSAALPSNLPPVRVPVRFKITFPFVMLAAVFAVVAAYLVSRYVLESITDRFENQLIEAGKLTADWMVREENSRLVTLRLIANTQGVAEALQRGDAERLRALVLPIAVNAQEDAVELMNADGLGVLSLRKSGEGPADYSAVRGESVFAEWAFVQKVLAGQLDREGDKFAGVADAPWGDYFYIAGPVYNANGTLAGAVLVGKPLRRLTAQMRADTLAHVTFYTASGEPLASTLIFDNGPHAPLPAETAAEVLARGAEASFIRDLSATSVDYSELVGPWQARNGERLGLAGIALAQDFLANPTPITQLGAFAFILALLVLVIVIGFVLAHSITRPLIQMVAAAQDVAQGNFQVRLKAAGDDEVNVLVSAFNYMISGLQEGSIYRDLLGRAVSPEVREQLRGSLSTGDLRLEGQTVTATVLMSDIRGFTTLSEKADPTTVLKWLNEYFSELVPVITAHGGVVDKFEGDAILAFFGVLPRPLPPRESAFQACRAALEMLQVIDSINARRIGRNEPLFITGIGLNTGPVTAGGLGAADRLNYTIIGDAVNTTQRIESLTRQFESSSAVISETTHAALRARRAMFCLQPLGAHRLKGKSEAVAVYRLTPGEATVLR
jgi:adenylate cyclase